MALTLLIAMLLIVGGIFRIVISIAARFHNGIWLLLHGVVNLLLGISHLAEMARCRDCG